MSVVLSYYKHSFFTIACNDYIVAIDPYDPNMFNVREFKVDANEVFCSHGHNDHNFTACINLTKKTDSPFKLTEIQSFHDEEKGAKRGPNTIRIFEAEGLRIAHFGDIGCKLLPEEIDILQDLDVALIPVGGFYTIDVNMAKELLEEIKPRVFIPMHYKTKDFGLEVIADIEDIKKEFNDYKIIKDKKLELNKALLGVYIFE